MALATPSTAEAVKARPEIQMIEAGNIQAMQCRPDEQRGDDACDECEHQARQHAKVLGNVLGQTAGLFLLRYITNSCIFISWQASHFGSAETRSRHSENFPLMLGKLPDFSWTGFSAGSSRMTGNR